MSTRSIIAIKKEDNSYDCIYCHYDGYPHHHLPILMEHYNTKERVESLIEPGDLSILDISNECPEGHSFDHRIDGYCVYYGRDRGEEGTEKSNCVSLYELMKHSDSCNAEHLYIFENDTWEEYTI